MKLEGKVAIVIGASYGIGLGHAHALAGEGATVVVSARSLGDTASSTPQAGTLAETVASGKGLPGSIHAKACDVLVEADVVRLIDETVTEFGRVDLLINNAAIYSHHDTFAIDQATWDQHLDLNVRGPFFAMREVSRHMKRQKSGGIVNITSAMAAPSQQGPCRP